VEEADKHGMGGSWWLWLFARDNMEQSMYSGEVDGCPGGLWFVTIDHSTSVFLFCLRSTLMPCNTQTIPHGKKSLPELELENDLAMILVDLTRPVRIPSEVPRFPQVV